MKSKAALIFIILLSACRQDIPAPVNPGTPTTFSAVWQDFWSLMNINYLYWDIDTTDWDRVNKQYSPVFATLDLNNPTDQSRAAGYFRQITDGLIDHHYEISFTSPALNDSTINPANDQLLRRAGFRNSFSYLFSDEHYLDSGFLFGFDEQTDPGNLLTAVAGTIHGNILFFTCSHMSLYRSFHSTEINGIQPVLAWFFNRLKDPTLKGLLLDLRDNPGGDVADLNFLAGAFLAQPLHFGYTRYKSGNGRLDYTPWINADILPVTGTQAPTLPIILLADQYTASLAELMVMGLRVLPNCRIVGETTFGATGPLTGNAVYNDGSFAVPGFMNIQTSSAEFKYLDGKIYEGKGFPPDYPVPFNAIAIGSGVDPQMDSALAHLP
jgi:carboxyl-terminal processing protease